MILSIALAQIQLRPDYGPNYTEDSSQPKNRPGHPVSPLREMRIIEYKRICETHGPLTVAGILDVFCLTHGHMAIDDARKILDCMVEDGLLVKHIRLSQCRQRAFYSAPDTSQANQ